MQTDFDSKFKAIKKSVKLSPAEKDLHRAALVRFMNTEARPRLAKIPSPFFVFWGRHFIVSGLVLVFLFGFGISVSADRSLPNELLYQIKIKINEPAMAFWASTQGKKAKIEVEFVNRRLKEFSQIALRANFDQVDQVSFMNHFSKQIAEAQRGIWELAEAKNINEAIELSNDLQAILSAHEVILDKLSLNDSVNENIEEFSAGLESSLATTTKILDSIIEAIETPGNETEFDQVIGAQEEAVTTTLNEARKKADFAELDLESESSNLDDRNYVERELTGISLILETAKQKKEEGSKKEALVLYNHADQALGKLESLVEAGQTLGIDVD